MKAKQHLVVHSAQIHQRPVSEMKATKCAASFKMMGPEAATGNVYFSDDQIGTGSSYD